MEPAAVPVLHQGTETVLALMAPAIPTSFLGLQEPFLLTNSRGKVRINWMGGTQYGLIALGGALGALARYFVGSWVQSRLPGTAFPWGTFIINATGSLILGFMATLLTERFLTNPNWRPFVTIGFVGAYTTFSTFEYESAQLGSSLQALGNLLGSVVVGYGCVWFGIRLALWITSLNASR